MSVTPSLPVRGLLLRGDYGGCLQALIDFIVANLRACWPFRVVFAWGRGVVYRFGKDIKDVGPGIHWVWPFMEEISVESVVERVVDLVAQSITTKDGKTVTVSVNVAFTVNDIRLKQTAVHAFDDSISAAALSHIGRKLSQWTWDEALGKRSELERSLRETLSTKVKKWGVTIEDVGIPDYVLAKQYRHFGIGEIA